MATVLSLVIVQLPLTYLLSRPVYTSRIHLYFFVVAALVAARYAYGYAMVFTSDVALHNATSAPAYDAAYDVATSDTAIANALGFAHALLALALTSVLYMANKAASADDDKQREHLINLIEELDKDGDGEVGLEAFTSTHACRARLPSPAHMLAAHRCLQEQDILLAAHTPRAPRPVPTLPGDQSGVPRRLQAPVPQPAL